MPARAMPAATLPVANATKRPGNGSELATPRRLTKMAATPPSAPKAKYSQGCGSLGLGASTASPNQRCEPAQPTIKIANQSYIGTPSCFLAAFALGSLCSQLGLPRIGRKGAAEKEITTSFRHGQIITPAPPLPDCWPSTYPVHYRGAPLAQPLRNHGRAGSIDCAMTTLRVVRGRRSPKEAGERVICRAHALRLRAGRCAQDERNASGRPQPRSS